MIVEVFSRLHPSIQRDEVWDVILSKLANEDLDVKVQICAELKPNLNWLRSQVHNKSVSRHWVPDYEEINITSKYHTTVNLIGLADVWGTADADIQNE